MVLLPSVSRAHKHKVQYIEKFIQESNMLSVKTPEFNVGNTYCDCHGPLQVWMFVCKTFLSGFLNTKLAVVRRIEWTT